MNAATHLRDFMNLPLTGDQAHLGDFYNWAQCLGIFVILKYRLGLENVRPVAMGMRGSIPAVLFRVSDQPGDFEIWEYPLREPSGQDQKVYLSNFDFSAVNK